MINKNIRVLVVGCGHMGASHARAYREIASFEVVGLVASSPVKRDKLSEELGGIPCYNDYFLAFKKSKPDVVCIATYPDTHAAYAIHALKEGAHVFVEKPLGTTIQEAEEVLATAIKYQRQLVVGLILRHHPSWKIFIDSAKALGKPLVMRLNLNQQSDGHHWITHQKLMQSLSPIVDCGIHYVDVMCQMTESKPLMVHGIAARLTNNLVKDMYNYGAFQITFEDGSVGWYEAGWGPMMSQTAYFVKDVIGPKGSVSIVPSQQMLKDSASIDSHTAANSLLMHSAELDNSGHFLNKEKYVHFDHEPSHHELCVLEQKYFLKAITENLDLSQEIRSGIEALRIVLAADQAIRTKSVVYFNEH